MGTDASRPLQGVRVVDIGYAMAGPVTGRYLAHWGADAIRIESRRRPDSLRVSRAAWYSPAVGPDEVAGDTSPLLNFSSAQKRSVVLEIDSDEGYEAFSRITATADVVITNLSADAIHKLRLTYDDIKAIKPDVVYLATTAFGDSGPYRSFRTWGMNLCAAAGIDSMIGWPDREPSGLGMSFPDYPAAIFSAAAIVAALRRRRRTGLGCHLELPQFNVAVNAIGPALASAHLTGSVRPPDGNRSTYAVPQGVYPCREEQRWVAVSVLDQQMWERLCQIEGLERLAADLRFATPEARLSNHDALDEILAEWTSGRSDWDAATTFQRVGVAASPVFDSWDVLADPHLASRSFYQLAPSARFGCDLVSRPAAAPEDMAQDVAWAAPALGEHTRDVLEQVAGYSGEKVDELVTSGIVSEMAEPQLRLRRPYWSWIANVMRLPWPTGDADG